MRAEEIVNEYGRRSHPGYGRAVFSKTHYVFIVRALRDLTDRHIKDYLIDWFGSIFAQDNPRFSSDKWKKAVDAGSYNTSTFPKFEQRHFYYLAGEICKIDDMHAREFVADFVGDLVGRTNPAFKKDRWLSVCDIQTKSE